MRLGDDFGFILLVFLVIGIWAAIMLAGVSKYGSTNDYRVGHSCRGDDGSTLDMLLCDVFNFNEKD